MQAIGLYCSRAVHAVAGSIIVDAKGSGTSTPHAVTYVFSEHVGLTVALTTNAMQHVELIARC